MVKNINQNSSKTNASSKRLELIKNICKRRELERNISVIKPSQYDIEEETSILLRKQGERMDTIDAKDLGTSLAIWQIFGD